MIKKLSWVLLALLVALGSWLPQASAYRFLRTKENGRAYHWKRNRFPIVIDVDKAGSPDVPFVDLQRAFQVSSETWNTVNCTVARLKMGVVRDKNPAPKYDSINLIRFVQSKADWPYSAQQVANTEIFYQKKTGEIVDADILFNDWNFKWGVKGEKDRFDVQATTTHEMGHLLGLEHTDNTGASMYARANVGETGKRNLNDDDRKGLCDLYPKQPCKEGELSGTTEVCWNGRYTKICPEFYSRTCGQCNTNDDCPGEKNFCLTLKDGKYCGYDCSATKSCAKGYTCESVDDGNGKNIGYNCAPDNLQCQGASKYPCCFKDDDCLPGFSCQKGQCAKGTLCAKESESCQSGGDCCAGLACFDNGTGKSCRQPCDPLAPKCPGNFRCAPLDNNFTKGVCLPPSGGGLENAACSKDKPCEYELGCEPNEKQCRFLCKPKDQKTCPSGYLCREVKGLPGVGLCEKESGTVACKTMNECPTGRVCKNLRCSPCQQNSECGARQRCQDGFCRAECQADSDCPRQHRCVQALCLPGVSCTKDSDCETGLVCQSSVCTTPPSSACTKDSECPASQRCLAEKKRCVPRSCQSDGACGPGAVCRQNACIVESAKCAQTCQEGQVCGASGRCLWTLGYKCNGDESCESGTCITVGEVSLCSKQCTTTDNNACPTASFCAELPNIGLGCWPAQFTECSDGRCKPKFDGCGCQTIDGEQSQGMWLMLFLIGFFGLRMRRKHV